MSTATIQPRYSTSMAGQAVRAPSTSTAPPTPTKRTNLERYPILQDLVKKKLQLKLQLNDLEKALIVKSWGSKTQSNERTISYMVNSPQFWEKVYGLLIERSPRVNVASLKVQTVSFPAMIQMAVLNLDDLNRMDDYLATLGRQLRRVFAVDEDQYFQLGEAMIDTMIEVTQYGHNNIDHFYEIIDSWSKIYCFLVNSIIQSFHLDPMLLINYEDPFEIPNVDVDRIIETHFKSHNGKGSPDSQATMGQDTDSIEDDATLFEKLDPVTTNKYQQQNEKITPVITENQTPVPTPTPMVLPLPKEVPKQLPAVQQQQPLPAVVASDATQTTTSSNDNESDDSDEADMYDIFKGSEAVSTKAKPKPISANNYAQIQRSSAASVAVPSKMKPAATSTKKMGFFKRMAVKATLE